MQTRPYEAASIEVDSWGQEGSLSDERLAIDGGEPLRREPFGPRWDFGEPEKRSAGGTGKAVFGQKAVKDVRP